MIGGLVITVVMIGQFAWWSYVSDVLTLVQMFVLTLGLAAIVVGLAIGFPLLMLLWIIGGFVGWMVLITVWL